MTVATWRRWAIMVAVLLVGVRTASAASKYKVRVDSAPPGATVYIDKKENGAVGVTPWAGSLTKGTHTVILELDGYLPASKQIKVARTRRVQDFFVPMTKKSDPPKIDVRADADRNVFGAAVIVDGQPQGNAPTVVTTTAGRHQVRLEKDGFQVFESWVETKENSTVNLAPILKESAKKGTIVVDSDVGDAEVFVDGNKVGTAPVVVNDLVEGLHVVEVRKEPAIPWKQTVQVEAGKQTKVHGELKATIGGQGGSVRVLSNVQGAHVYLDGTDMGAVPLDIKDVKAGEHVIEVKSAKYQPREERVTVNAGSATVLKLDLNAEAKTEAKIKVLSPVPGADVYIDGALIGKVPAETEVSSGEHYVVVKLEGYKTFEHKSRIEAGQVQTVSAELRAVGKLRILSDPTGATVLINGIPQEKPTPLEVNEAEVGETVVRVEMSGMIPQEKTLTVVGGKSEVLSFKLDVQGLSEEDLLAEQRGLSSFGARTLPRGRSTIDLSIGYPYFGTVKVNVGAGKAGNFGFDAGVGVRTFFSRSELGLGVRFMLVDADPFTAGAFSDLWWGSRLLDSSKRNGLTWDAGLVASLTALTHVTVSGRLYLDMWSDRHCPEINSSNQFAMDARPIAVCEQYRQFKAGEITANATTMRMEALTGEAGASMFEREEGIRVMASVIAEIAMDQRYNFWFMLEGAPFQGERALFTDLFAAPMLESDYETYARVGLTYKF